MTVPQRNLLFRIAIAVALGMVCVPAAAVWRGFRLFPAFSARAGFRPLPSVLDGLLGGPDAYAPLAAAALFCLFSLVTLSLIYYFFEKTPSPEILCFAVFVFSCSFEAARLVIPFRETANLPVICAEAAGRTLIFARSVGLFALFAGSVCASGLTTRREGGMLALICVASLLVAIKTPVNAVAWDSAYMAETGFRMMLALVELFLAAFIVLDLLVAARVSGSREYRAAALGAFLAVAGKFLLASCDTWLVLALGLAALSAGAWFFCTSLHRLYLWL